MTDTTTLTDLFFDRYAAALLARDEKAVAALYAVPALILFPGRSIAVSDARQTEQFFASSWDQYEGVDEAERSVKIMAEAPGTVWADVIWTYGGRVQERFCYQLVEGPDGHRIAVLTPLARPWGGCAGPVMGAGDDIRLTGVVPVAGHVHLLMSAPARSEQPTWSGACPRRRPARRARRAPHSGLGVWVVEGPAATAPVRAATTAAPLPAHPLRTRRSRCNGCAGPGTGAWALAQPFQPAGRRRRTTGASARPGAEGRGGGRYTRSARRRLSSVG